MRGGAEILLDGGYMTANMMNMYEFVVTRNGAGHVVINLTALRPPSLPLPPPLQPIHLSYDDYQREFFPVVDNRVKKFRGFNGTWWSRAMLEPAPHHPHHPPNDSVGGKHQRNKRSGKKRNHKSRRSTRRDSRRSH